MNRRTEQLLTGLVGAAAGAALLACAGVATRRERLGDPDERAIGAVPPPPDDAATRDVGTGLRNERWARARLERGGPALLVDLADVSSSYARMGLADREALVHAAALRLSPLVAGGDEVARVDRGYLLVVLDSNETADIAKQALDVFDEPVAGPHGPLRLAVNVAHGVVHGSDALGDLAHALMLAVRRGPGAVAEVSRELTLAATRRVDLERDLLDAVSRDELDLAWQPIVDLETGAVAAAEALLRWRREGDDVSPSDFVPVAEASGAIREIGSWVLDEAFRQLAEVLADPAVDDEVLPLGLHVNVSPRQLEDPLFARRVTTAAAAAGVDACRLTIELTEHVLARHPDAALVQLQALAALGVGVAIDDFGTGYSSLSYLARMPVDVIKVDRSFVPSSSITLPEAGETDMESLAAGIFRLVGRVADVVVAEGIEDVAQRDRVRLLGATHAQGYLFGRPTALRALVADTAAAPT